jgi:hypothetical protein
MYNTEGGINVGLILFADDNLTPFASQMQKKYVPCCSYTVNTNKSAA